jgi:hypothetical protein
MSPTGMYMVYIKSHLPYANAHTYITKRIPTAYAPCTPCSNLLEPSFTLNNQMNFRIRPYNHRIHSYGSIDAPYMYIIFTGCNWVICLSLRLWNRVQPCATVETPWVIRDYPCALSTLRGWPTYFALTVTYVTPCFTVLLPALTRLYRSLSLIYLSTPVNYVVCTVHVRLTRCMHGCIRYAAVRVRVTLCARYGRNILLMFKNISSLPGLPRLTHGWCRFCTDPTGNTR